ncbi:MAG: BrnT family toxin [Amaricoccus sp.]
MDFDWDDGNRAKAQKHGLTLSEIEHAMRTGARVAPDPAHSLSEQRFIAIGRTPAGRPVFIAFCFRGARIRPISARHMHAREVARHEAALGSDDDDR